VWASGSPTSRGPGWRAGRAAKRARNLRDTGPPTHGSPTSRGPGWRAGRAAKRARNLRDTGPPTHGSPIARAGRGAGGEACAKRRRYRTSDARIAQRQARSGRRVGNRITSRMLATSASSITTPVDPEAEATRRRQPQLHRPQVRLVEDHGLLVAGRLRPGLRLEPLALVGRVDQLGEGVGELPAGRDQLEAFGDVRLGPVLAGERGHLDGVVEHEGRVPQVRLDQLLEQLEHELAGPERLVPGHVVRVADGPQLRHRQVVAQLGVPDASRVNDSSDARRKGPASDTARPW
jgi:hypothetical protein